MCPFPSTFLKPGIAQILWWSLCGVKEDNPPPPWFHRIPDWFLNETAPRIRETVIADAANRNRAWRHCPAHRDKCADAGIRSAGKSPLNPDSGPFTRIDEYVPLATPESGPCFICLRHQVSPELGNVSSSYKRHVPPPSLPMPYNSAQEATTTFIPSSIGNLTLVLIRSLALETSMSQG